MFNIWSTLIIHLLLLVGHSRADQPVHCVTDDIIGTWLFHVSPIVQFVNLFKTKEVCTHNVPNKFQIINKDYKFKFEQEHLWEVQLMDGHKVKAQLKNQKKPQVFAGNWSPYYDQSMIVTLENGIKFIANFRYNVKYNVTRDPLHPSTKEVNLLFRDEMDKDNTNFDTDCKQTMPGFVQDTNTHSTISNHRIQCFYGHQINQSSPFKSVEEKQFLGPNPPTKGVQARIIKKGQNQQQPQKQENGTKENKRVVHTAQKSAQSTFTIDLKDILDTESSVELVKEDNKNESKINSKGKEVEVTADLEKYEDNDIFSKIETMYVQQSSNIKLKNNQRKQIKRAKYHRDTPSEETNLLIETVNSLDLGWKADTCKLQKTHPKYDSKECDQKDQQLVQDEKRKKQAFGSQKNFKEALEEARKYQKKYATADAIPDSELPKNFDWRNIKGVNFTNQHRDQGHCGNCYSQTFIQVVEMRLNLKYGTKTPILSPGLLNSCNYLNESCEGGWSLFDANFAENGYLITEKCALLAQGDRDKVSCGAFEKCQPHSKIKKSYFVGQEYGATTEKNMMKEILRNGMVTASFKANLYFDYYDQGIISEQGINKVNKALSQSQSVSDTSLFGYGLTWKESDHSIVGVGWGVDPVTNQKYWIMRNSYGTKWGEHGDFRINRGTDAFAIESMTIGYDPVLCKDTKC